MYLQVLIIGQQAHLDVISKKKTKPNNLKACMH